MDVSQGSSVRRLAGALVESARRLLEPVQDHQLTRTEWEYALMTSNYDSTAPLRLSRPGALMRSLGPSAALFAALGCSSGNGDGQTPGSQSSQNQFVPQHPNCGNNVLDAAEPCDGTQFRYQVTCAFATNNGLTAGAVTC